MDDKDGKVLSYGDVLLRQSDVSLLDGPHFLNDQIIEFFFNYLSKQYYTSLQQTNLTPLLLVGPTLTFWLLHCPDSEGLTAAINPLRLHQRELVIFALNNNEDVEMVEGGTHWSLLMFDRTRFTFEHFDSLSGTNNRQARELMEIIKPHMGAGGARAKFIEQAIPQQENSYDCGVYVMAVANALCNAFQGRKGVPSRSNEYAGIVRTSVSPSSVNRMRYTTMDLIYSLSQNEDARDN